MEMERALWVWLMYLHDVLKQGVSRINRAVWLSLLCELIATQPFLKLFLLNFYQL